MRTRRIEDDHAGVGAAFAWGASDFFGGALRRGMPVFAVLVITQLIGLVLLVPVLILHGVAFPHDPRILFAAAAGLGATLELCLVYLAISRGDSFITAPVAAIGATLAVLTGLIGGEQLSLPVAAGLTCALCGGLSSAFTSPKRPSSMPAAAGICLGAAVGWQVRWSACTRPAGSTRCGRPPCSTPGRWCRRC